MNDTDEIIAEIRRARCEISRRYKHDVYKYVKHLVRRETECARGTGKRQKAPPSVRGATATRARARVALP